MNMGDIAHREKMLSIIQRIPSGIPDGWQKTTYAVGGLLYIGFSNICTEKLVVISSQRQSVIDCRTGNKTYGTENYDEDNLVALSEELGDEVIPIAGDSGGGLRRLSKDGNILMSVAPYWPMEKIVFMPNYTLYTLHPEKCNIIFEDYGIKAFGFSKCGNYIAVGTSGTLDIFRKNSHQSLS